MAATARSVTSCDASACSSVAAPACRASSRSAPTGVPISTVNPSPSSSVREKIEAGGAAGSGLHGGAEAGRPGDLTVHADEDGALTPRAVGGIGDQEDPVLDLDGVQIARSQADESEARLGQRLRRDLDRAVVVARARLDRFAGREQEPLAGVGAVCPREQSVVPRVLQTVRAGTVDLPHAARQVADTVDVVEHDSAVTDGGPYHVVAALLEQREEALEPLTRQMSHRAPHVETVTIILGHVVWCIRSDRPGVQGSVGPSKP